MRRAGATPSARRGSVCLGRFMREVIRYAFDFPVFDCRLDQFRVTHSEFVAEGSELRIVGFFVSSAG